MTKTHLKVLGIDARDSVTRNMDDVDRKHCLRSKEMQHYHQFNRTLTDSQGCY
ncbi:hypothetical protein [Vibrio sp. 1180_3]|uniref:hypothetical protein n=1 Tax=Vibrio sp. 1180_3 TaxID=2528832 RepID=UPI002406D445|nr:hypothetical protein [Vibrio sp. 1180_3]